MSNSIKDISFIAKLSNKIIVYKNITALNTISNAVVAYNINYYYITIYKWINNYNALHNTIIGNIYSDEINNVILNSIELLRKYEATVIEEILMELDVNYDDNKIIN